MAIAKCYLHQVSPGMDNNYSVFIALVQEHS